MSQSYSELLLDPRWLTRRQEILDRDDHMCRSCFDNSNLNVHHKYYQKGKMPWEYPDDALITLCQRCHFIEHDWPKDSIRPDRCFPEHISIVVERVVLGVKNGVV